MDLCSAKDDVILELVNRKIRSLAVARRAFLEARMNFLVLVVF